MNCQDCQDALPWLLNGGLKGPERGAVVQHLAGCESCLRVLGEIDHLLETVDLAAPTEVVAASSAHGSRSEFLGAEDAVRAEASRESEAAPARWLMAAAALFAATLTTWLALGWPASNSQDELSPSAESAEGRIAEESFEGGLPARFTIHGLNSELSGARTDRIGPSEGFEAQNWSSKGALTVSTLTETHRVNG